MSRRCYSETPLDGARSTIAGPEAHHLLHVMRAAPGMRVRVFDGSGCEYEAEVIERSRTSVELALLERHDADRELPFALTLGVALPKGDRQRWLVEKAVELGATRLVPLATQRSEKHDAEKLRRYVIEASKQCGRNRLMAIDAPLPWDQWLAASGDVTAVRRWVAHPGGAAIAPADLASAADTLLAVGPEGGLTDAEVAAAEQAGWRLVGLGPRILRIETAAIALAAALALASLDQA